MSSKYGPCYSIGKCLRDSVGKVMDVAVSHSCMHMTKGVKNKYLLFTVTTVQRSRLSHPPTNRVFECRALRVRRRRVTSISGSLEVACLSLNRIIE